MKVLFAVSNEEISESIVKKYQKEYKQIISYKNVYYFNAILKELQKDKSYDRIVISEDLEAFTHTQYDQIDKFIFDKLDSISDEASNSRGNDIPIILICSDRRTTSEQMLVKIFGIGVYNAILGNDRSVEEVCRLINKPRAKKDAKNYYKIDAENVNYQSENENDVSEMEIQNILAHYKRLGKNEDRYIESFNNIAAQYNDTQLRIISKFLPLNVRAVLEEQSQKYQQIMSFNNSVSNQLRKPKKEIEEEGLSGKLLMAKDKAKIMSRPVVIPSAIDINQTKKMSKINNQMQQHKENEQNEESFESVSTNYEQINTLENTVKRGRGRPRKKAEVKVEEQTVKRGRGRPRKNPIPDVEEQLLSMMSLEEEQDREKISILPGFEENDNFSEIEENILPGFDKEEITESEDTYLPEIYTNNTFTQNEKIITNINDSHIENIDLSHLLTTGKKIVTFVGTSKNGTSFIVNNLAQLLSTEGVNVAILDITKNRNSYYIYTKNEEELRKIAANSVEGLATGIANGILVNKNLTVYTSLPNEIQYIENVDRVLETLLKKHSLILIDADFESPMGYFKQSQETYLVQTLDILTIQPLTAFLRELKSKNILEERKLRIILNKAVKIRGITDKTIIGGMAYYNDPAMSFMTELFDRNIMKYVSIPFEEETYIRYLENVVECNISLKGYSKTFMRTLKELGNIVYPTTNTYRPPTVGGYGSNNSFSPSINNTLNQMKNNY